VEKLRERKKEKCVYENVSEQEGVREEVQGQEEKGYNPHTGRLTGRAVGAQERLDKLAERYVAEGMSLAEARARAREEMRDNGRKDWRTG